MALAAASGFIYLANWRTVPSGDTIPASLLPIVLITEGKTDFGEFKRHYEDGGTVWFFTATHRGYVSSYPLAAGLLATPIYVVPVWWIQHFQHPTPLQWLPFASVMEKISATIFTALSVWTFFEVALALEATLPAAVLLSITYAFGTEAWSTYSQALWMHGPGVLFLLLTGLAAAKFNVDQRRTTALLAGLFGGICVAVRLNNVLMVGPLLLVLLLRERKFFAYVFVPFTVLVGTQLLYNVAWFGLVTGKYALSFNEPLIRGLNGLLFSPGRGLIIYFPVAIFAVIGLVKATRSRLRATVFYCALAASIVGVCLFVAKWSEWYGGGSFGPRLLAEIQPLLLLLTIPFCRKPLSDLNPVKVLFLLTIIWSIGVQSLGALRQSDWNARPININDSRERLWDWLDTPFSRALENSAETTRWPSPSACWLLPATRLLAIKPRELGRDLALEMESGWYLPESNRQGAKIYVSDWGKSDATILLSNTGQRPVKVRFHVAIRSNVPKNVSLELDQREIWRGDTSRESISLTSDSMLIEPGVHRAVFKAPTTPSAPDPRPLSIGLYEFEVREEK